MHENPPVSVLLIVYSDSPLCREAINSVATQTLSKSDIELVIITSFPQEFDIPKELENDSMLRIIESKELTSGGKVKEGLRSSRGKVVAFLDYDDTWENNRLFTVEKAFSEEDRLGYYHNGCTFVRNNQEPEVGIYRTLASGILSTQAENRIIDPSNSSAAEIIKWMGAGTYNMSSIAASKDMLLAFSEKIPDINLSIEDVIFFNSLDAGRRGMQDSKRLTRVRMHGTNVSNASNRSRNIEHERQAISSLTNLMNETANDAVCASLKSYIPAKELYSQLSIEFAKRGAVAKQLITYLTTYRTSGMLPNAVLTGMAASYLVSPSIYTRLLNKRFR